MLFVNGQIAFLQLWCCADPTGIRAHHSGAQLVEDLESRLMSHNGSD